MIAVSIVSHGHGEMVWHLVRQLTECPEVTEVLVTLNKEESYPVIKNKLVTIINNEAPKGFGANHNAAYQKSKSRYFCVMNPDIVLVGNPFTALINTASDSKRNIGVVAPLVIAKDGAQEDSMRYFITPLLLLKRMLGIHSGVYEAGVDDEGITPDWVAGMFMFFKSESYAAVKGFDEGYFMYCEDIDICCRLWKSGYCVVVSSVVSVIHNAQRASRKNLTHLKWHVMSMMRYFKNHSFGTKIRT